MLILHNLIRFAYTRSAAACGWRHPRLLMLSLVLLLNLAGPWLRVAA
jgi:hypothetical protein